MPVSWKQHVIVDANVLIDYCESDLSVLCLFSEKIQSVHIGKSTLNKVKQITEAEAEQNRLLIEIPSIELALEAAAKRGSLAYDDRETLLLAKENAWCCLTNDKPLRQECLDEKVRVLWGLEPMKILIFEGLMTTSQALQVARKISATNPAFITEKILARFEGQIKKIKRS